MAQQQVIEHCLQVRRKRRLELHAAAVGRMREGQSQRVEERPLESKHGQEIGGDALARAAVRGVAHDRMADGAQVHANLMRAPGRDRDLAQRDAAQMLRPRDAGDRRPRPPGARRHLLPVVGVAPDRQVDPASGLHDAPDQRHVFLVHLAVLELLRQRLVRRIVLRDDHHARRALVQAMHDARTQLAADAAEIGDVVEQRVDQRARVVARRRVHDHAGGLVHDDDVGVLVEDGERQILGHDLAWPPAPECPRSTRSPSRTARFGARLPAVDVTSPVSMKR